jgi:glycosyltransferase involved in cell wall biosynthesis
MREGSTLVVVHNFYQHPGGEDEVFRAETGLLNTRGHTVIPFVVRNDTIGATAGLRVAAATLWNHGIYRELRALFRKHRPKVAHFHNTFPLVSPAAYYAARAEKVPVVQTLHNFRLSCPNALFYRQGRPCEDCLGKAVPWPGVLHACYRGSRAATGVTAAMLALHRGLGTWSRSVDVYIALSRFARDKFIAAGLPADRIRVKPNFLFPEPGIGEHKGNYALFIGRLAPEKGLATLLEAWRVVGDRYTLKVVGEGSQDQLLRVPRPGIEWLGWQSRERVLDLMREAAFLVLPSEWYENFPVTLVEAYATGLPVIGSAIGSLAELISDYGTGRHFRPGDAADLAGVLEWALSHPAQLAEQGRMARREFELKYTAERNYQELIEIYQAAGEHARLVG